jgi:alkaline phosphatase D
MSLDPLNLNIPVTRRAALRSGLVAGAGLLAGATGAPAFVRARPALPYGVQSGDPAADGAVVWTRADRASRMVVEVAPTERFANPRRIAGPLLDASSDFTGSVAVGGLPPGQEVFYRVFAQDPRDPSVRSEPVVGELRTAPRGRRDVTFTWSGDLAGQGWGINPAAGGFRIFETMRGLEPDFYVCSGDHVYADGPMTESGPASAPAGWRQIVTEAKSKVAQSLDDYRGQYLYNLLDDNLRAFNAQVTQVHQWDDHEVRNNWYPGQVISDPRYSETRVDVLAARARQAYGEYLPMRAVAPDEAGRVYRKIPYGPLLDVFVLDMRTYKDPNDDNRYADPHRGLLGEAQRGWLKRELAASTETWKVIANDLPLGLVVPDGPGRNEGVPQGDGGPPLGRELEFADVLRTAHAQGVENIVFITADVHYAAAHHYDPARAAVGDFSPFWEFVAGPLHAGVASIGSLNALDTTFGAERVFSAAAPVAGYGPAQGYQYFGHVAIDGASRRMTVSLRDQDGAVLHTTELDPQ